MKTTMNSLEQRIAEIKARPYRRELVRESNGGWFACISEFPGCMTQGDTPAQAFENLDDAMNGWLHVMLEDGDEVPEPFAEHRFSGRTVVRLGPALHRDAARAAKREGQSLNQFIVSAVARTVGMHLEVGTSAASMAPVSRECFMETGSIHSVENFRAWLGSAHSEKKDPRGL